MVRDVAAGSPLRTRIGTGLWGGAVGADGVRHQRARFWVAPMGDAHATDAAAAAAAAATVATVAAVAASAGGEAERRSARSHAPPLDTRPVLRFSHCAVVSQLTVTRFIAKRVLTRSKGTVQRALPVPRPSPAPPPPPPLPTCSPPPGPRPSLWPLTRERWYCGSGGGTAVPGPSVPSRVQRRTPSAPSRFLPPVKMGERTRRTGKPLVRRVAAAVGALLCLLRLSLTPGVTPPPLPRSRALRAERYEWEPPAGQPALQVDCNAGRRGRGGGGTTP